MECRKVGQHTSEYSNLSLSTAKRESWLGEARTTWTATTSPSDSSSSMISVKTLTGQDAERSSIGATTTLLLKDV